MAGANLERLPRLLALVPYALLRVPFNRLARLFLPAARAPPAGPTHDNTFIH